MADPRIYEYKNEQHPDAEACYRDLMTDEEFERGKYYSEQYFIRRSEVDAAAITFKWDELEQMFQCKRDPHPTDPFYPKSFVSVVTPTVEGQAAHMTTADMDVSFVSDNPAHEKYMRKLDAAAAYTRRVSKFTQHLKDSIRDYLLFGGCWMTVEWETAYGRTGNKPKGYAKACAVPLREVLVDGRIKDYKDLQQAEYIIRKVGYVPISTIRREYGDEYADAIQNYHSTAFNNEDSVSTDDFDSAMVLHVWTRSNEQNNLQLIEMDVNGLILRESDSSSPFYEMVDNEYPFYFARGMPSQGSFYGFGDGLILYPLQKTINNLTDELELASRYNAQPRTFIDERSGVDPDDLTSDPSVPVLATNPQQTIWQSTPRGISPVVQNMIDYLLREAQRMTRFSDIMTGAAQAASTTATATQNRVIQSSVGINDKKADIVEMIKWAMKYCMKLSLEKWDAPVWFRTESRNNPEMVDLSLIGNGAPASMEPSPDYLTTFMENNPTASPAQMPNYELIEEAGEVVYADLDFDADVVIGNNIPRGKSEMFQVVMQLMQLQVLDADGQVRPFMSAKKARDMIEHYLGIPMQEDDEQAGEERVMAPNTGGMNPASGSGAAQQMNNYMASDNPMNAMGVMPGTTNENRERIQGE